jgi:hypothetical protein
MRAALLVVCTFLSAISCGASPLSRAFPGLWVVHIENLQHKVVTTIRVEFTNDPAESCMGGDWKRVIVKSHQTSDKHFFPFAEPLSYQLEGGGIVIGRNEVCDGYLHLKGNFRDSVVQGEYVSFGLQGGDRLGYFSLSRSP